LDGWTVQGSGGGLAAVLARFVPWGCANSEALRGGDNSVEGMKSWARDEGGLVGNPEVTDRFEGVGEYNSLHTSHVRNMEIGPDERRSYSVA